MSRCLSAIWHFTHPPLLLSQVELSASVFEQICELAKGKAEAVAAIKRTRALFAEAMFDTSRAKL